MRWRVEVTGIVQGVGFRPFVYHLARSRGLVGLVRNHSGGVVIEVEGPGDALEDFLRQLRLHPPPLARIDTVRQEVCPARGEASFEIEASQAQAGGPVLIGPDIATCDDCLRELFDPADRRYLYPFLNCTNCGPRLTIIRSAPYDRERTTMVGFPMCPACRAEYDDPGDRRFHAQPTACPACGPRLTVLDEHGGRIEVDDPIAYTAEQLRQGRILAIKGLGGYHLACAAGSEEVVARLRQRKQRDEKPFALMVANLQQASALCEVSAEEAQLLLSPRRPIVLLRCRPAAPVAESVAPGNPFLGIMLPYTPLHHLLLRQLAGLPVVMTSGNRSDEPIAFEDADALARLAGIADCFLSHDRPIHLRCDDSVTRVMCVGPEAREVPIRRARGYAPQPIVLPRPCMRPMLALGGQLKATFALGRGPHALLSHHLGDLDHYRAYEAYTQAIQHYEDLFDLHPEVLIHDLHPDYASTRYALDRLAREKGLQRVGVQHHHAHLASCLAEHGLVGPALGITFDGTGFGTDGTVWGGEFLLGDLRSFTRVAYLRPVPMIGGEQAIREPWRLALAHLHDAGEEGNLLAGLIPPTPLGIARHILDRVHSAEGAGGLNAPFTSSMGRLFDAVASLCGVRQRVSYEGQAAVELEALAQRAIPCGGSYPIAWTVDADGALVIDTRPLIRAVCADVRRGRPVAEVAWRFHTWVAEMSVQVCVALAERVDVDIVTLSGGVFLNAFLSEELARRLTARGFRVYCHRQVPPNDGGLSLGQLAIAASLPHPVG
jgi:hydrogenase maturation protein HypF